MNDLFLKIIAGEIPASRVYEDEETYAFLDIKPSNKGHVLVVPKKYYRNILDIEEAAFCALMKTVHRLAPAVCKATGATGINIIMNNEPSAGQIIFHAHVHLVPRFEADEVFQPAKHTSYEEGEMESVAEAIRNNLKN